MNNWHSITTYGRLDISVHDVLRNYTFPHLHLL